MVAPGADMALNSSALSLVTPSSSSLLHCVLTLWSHTHSQTTFHTLSSSHDSKTTAWSSAIVTSSPVMGLWLSSPAGDVLGETSPSLMNSTDVSLPRFKIVFCYYYLYLLFIITVRILFLFALHCANKIYVMATVIGTVQCIQIKS